VFDLAAVANRGAANERGAGDGAAFANPGAADDGRRLISAASQSETTEHIPAFSLAPSWPGDGSLMWRSRNLISGAPGQARR